jgi:hypothetical protein
MGGEAPAQALGAGDAGRLRLATNGVREPGGSEQRVHGGAGAGAGAGAAGRGPSGMNGRQAGGVSRCRSWTGTCTSAGAARLGPRVR